MAESDPDAETETGRERPPAEDEKSFRVFRFRDAPEIMESGIMAMDAIDPHSLSATAAPIQAAMLDGADSRVVFAGFGMSIVHVWFKRGFPLPLHKHDGDCVYYIIAGGLRIGTQDLGAGDGFFVPANMPYTYRPGADGVELIEFRNETRFDIQTITSDAYWKKAAALIDANQAEWIGARRPTGIHR